MTLWLVVAAGLVSVAWAVGVWWVVKRVMENTLSPAVIDDAAGTGASAMSHAKLRWLAIAAAAFVGIGLFAAIWNFIAAHPEFTAASPQSSIVNVVPPGTADAPTKQTSGDLNVLLKRLEDRMAKEPGDAEGWALLARSYMELKRYSEAATTYAKATAKLPNEASLWVEYVDAEVMSHERKWTPAATTAIARALKLAPEHPKALWLAGTERFENKDYKGAVKQWEILARIAPADSDYAKEIRPALLEAKALAEGRDPREALREANVSVAPVATLTSVNNAKAGDDRTALFAALRQELGDGAAGKAGTANVSAKTVVTPTTGPRVAGKVAIDPALRAQVQPGDTLFVFARAEGKSMTGGTPGNAPVAVARLVVGDWPVSFSLTDQNAMSPQASLSTVSQVRIVARISHSGDAKAATGDLEGVSDVTSVNADNIQVVIKRSLP